MQTLLYAVLIVQILALITAAAVLPIDKKEFSDWVKRVCN